MRITILINCLPFLNDLNYLCVLFEEKYDKGTINISYK